VKGQVIDTQGVSSWGYGGQTMGRGDWVNGTPSDHAADQVNAWKKALDVPNTHLIVEHEYPPARIQDPETLKPILQASLAFVRHLDQAAASMYALQHEVLASQGIPIQGVGRQAYRT
jgi:hypothetical protein